MPSSLWNMCTRLAFFIAFAFALANAKKIYPTIYVDQSGKGNFSTIQSAIDSVPPNNNKWICIYVKPGVYREQVLIPYYKPFIYIKGDHKRNTTVIWDAHDSTATSATFYSQADNIVVKSISFTNSYNFPPESNNNPIKPALAAMISGDKSAFYRCAFYGYQDTLWDVQGRHYFKLCTIQGTIDFIFGGGQSIYERCTISVIARSLNGMAGFITAQSRSEPNDESGFVFKECNVIGNGKTFLGRPWRDHARVIFYNTSLSDVVVSQGWASTWGSVGREQMLTFAEHDCHGPGADTSSRVGWETKLSQEEINQFTSLSYIDKEGWISNQTYNMLS